MLSIIISSYQIDYFEQFKRNVEVTIGCNFVYEIVSVQNNNEYSINEANVALYSDDIQSYLLSLKKDAKYKARYIGSMVADIHRILIRGGIFLYPQDHKHPHGKLRLMHEVNAMARLVEVAAGRALSEGHASPLSLTPTDIHQRVSIVVGSAGEVEKYAQMVKNE